MGTEASMNACSEAVFYLGTYTNTPAESRGIYRGTLNTITGQLGCISCAGAMENPSYFAFSPDRRYLYAVHEKAEGAISAFSLREDGTLQHLNTKPTEGAAPCHVVVDALGKHVLVANYNGGNVISFPVRANGSLGAPTVMIPYEGSSVHPRRQTAPHAHSIYINAENERVYSCDLGTDSVWIFQFDAERGTMIPNDPPVFKGSPGAGPRHLAFAPSGKFLYLVNEMDLSVSVLSVHANTGNLTEVQTLSSLPEGVPADGSLAAAVKLHPNGRWLYVSNRGHDSITIFEVDPDERLRWIDNVPAGVQAPRDFAVDPSGQWMLVAGQKDGLVTVLEIDPKNGMLSGTDQSATLGSPVCVAFAT